MNQKLFAGLAVFVITALAALGIQTLRLMAETNAHTQTKLQWATENAQAAKQLTRLGERYRATERNLKERADAALESYLHVAQQGQLARDDAVRAVERLRQLAATSANAAAQLPAAAASAGLAGPHCAAQLAACGQLLAQGAGLAARGGELAAEGSSLAHQLDAAVTLCGAAWPASLAGSAVP